MNILLNISQDDHFLLIVTLGNTDRPTQLGKLFVATNYSLKQLSKIPSQLAKLFLGIEKLHSESSRLSCYWGFTTKTAC